jgi:ATP-dependent DNA helicase RecG
MLQQNLNKSMLPDQIKSIIALGEGYQAEFKASVPPKVRELTEEICAFANSAGGVLLVGVDDANSVKGIQLDNAKRSAIQNSIGEISPKLACMPEAVNVDGMNIVVFQIPSGKNKPDVFSGAIYVRVGTNTQKLTTAEEMRDFFQQADKIYFDESACMGFKGTTQIDAANFSAFRADAGFHSSISDSQIWQNLQLFTEDNQFKNGSVLFFGTHPEELFNQAIIRCVAFKGNDKRYIADDKKFGGPLYQQYLQAMEWLRGKINVAYDIEGQGRGPRKENWEIPETVFKEAIINALSHRDYYEKGAVTTIEVFDDRVEIANPGGLLAAVGHEFGRRSLSRNPLIFGLFDRMHLVEKIGSGVPRMQELMQIANLAAPEFRKEGMFTVVLARPASFSVETKGAEKLNETQLRILKLIAEDGNLTISSLGKLIGISETAIENNLKKLKEQGFIGRVGGRKDGKWIIL